MRRHGVRLPAGLRRLVDHLAKEDSAPAVLTALAAVVVVEIDRFGVTLDQFIESLTRLKADRDAELGKRAREN